MSEKDSFFFVFMYVFMLWPLMLFRPLLSLVFVIFTVGYSYYATTAVPPGSWFTPELSIILSSALVLLWFLALVREHIPEDIVRGRHWLASWPKFLAIPLLKLIPRMSNAKTTFWDNAIKNDPRKFGNILRFHAELKRLGLTRWYEEPHNWSGVLKEVKWWRNLEGAMDVYEGLLLNGRSFAWDRECWMKSIISLEESVFDERTRANSIRVWVTDAAWNRIRPHLGTIKVSAPAAWDALKKHILRSGHYDRLCDMCPEGCPVVAEMEFQLKALKEDNELLEERFDQFLKLVEELKLWSALAWYVNTSHVSVDVKSERQQHLTAAVMTLRSHDKLLVVEPEKEPSEHASSHS